MNYMVHVFGTMWRIKNQPSNFTPCSDNALHLLVLVAGILYWGLQMTSSFSIWGCILKGCFERDIFWRAELRLKDIETSILNTDEHWHFSNVFTVQFYLSNHRTSMKFVFLWSRINAFSCRPSRTIIFRKATVWGPYLHWFW